MLKVGTDFSGLGCPEEAIKSLGIEHENVFACEIDSYAKKSYLANHKPLIFYDDITKRDNRTAPYVDLYVFGFPCQAFSVSGKMLGFEDTRGTLFFNSLDYIAEKRPRYFIAENVKGLLSHDKPKGSKAKHGKTFNTIIDALAISVNGQHNLHRYKDCVDYHVYYAVLNTKNYGIPQNRERIFIVGFRDAADIVGFKFPKPVPLNKRLIDILEPVVAEKYYLSEQMMQYLMNRKGNFNRGKINLKTGDDIASCINATSGKTDISENLLVLNEPIIIHNNNGFIEQRDNINCIDANYHKGLDNHSQRSFILEPNNQIQIPEPTKKGFSIAEPGDSVNLKALSSKTMRGRVGDQIANTLDTQCNMGVVVNELIFIDGVGDPNRLEDDKRLSRNFKEGYRIYDPSGIAATIKSNGGGPGQASGLYLIPLFGSEKNNQSERVYSPEGIGQTIASGAGGGGAKTGLFYINNRIRKLTPRECFYLQGFDPYFFDNCAAVGISDTQLYKQAGNSMTKHTVMNVIASVLKIKILS